MTEAAFTRRNGRKHRTSPDGTALERSYVYLRPEVWQALEALMQRTGTTSKSLPLTNLILSAEKPTMARHDLTRSP